MQHLTLSERNGIAEIVINRKPVNALNDELVEELGDTIVQIENSDSIRVVILRSELSVFMAGADIKMMEELQKNKESFKMSNYVRSLQETLNKLENLNKPVIAYINGHAMGGGLELALACDFRVMASGKARISLPEVQLGLIPGAGGTQRLTRIIGETKAKEMIYFAEQLTAEEAQDLGIVSYVFTEKEGLAQTRKLATKLAEKAPIALASVKRCIQSASSESLQLGSEKELTSIIHTFNTEDAKTGLDSFLNKQTPRFKGR